MSTKKEFGDFQTPPLLAQRVVTLVEELYGAPDIVIEPTAGLGSFLSASSEHWKTRSDYEGYEINEEYVHLARKTLKQFGVRLLQRDFLLYRERLDKLFEIQIVENRQVFSIPPAFEKSARLY